MADTSKSVNVHVGANVQGAARGFEQVRGGATRAKQATEKLGSELSKTEAAAKKAGMSAHAYSQRLAAVRARQEKFTASLKQTSFSFEKMAAVGGKALAAAVVIRGVDAFAERAAKLNAVMGNLPYSIDQAANATGGMVRKFELAKLAVQANRMQVAKSSADYARFAAAATKVGLSVGEDASTAIAELTLALGRGSAKILDNYGIILTQEEAVRRYALAIGKTVEELTEWERGEAFRVEAMKEIIALADKQTIALGEGVQAWIALRNAAADYGDVAIEATGRVLAALQDWLVGTDPVIERLNELSGGTSAVRGSSQLLSHEQRVAQERKRIRQAREESEWQSHINTFVGPVKDADYRHHDRRSRRGGGGGGIDVETEAETSAAMREMRAEMELSEMKAQLREEDLENQQAYEQARAENQLSFRLRALEDQRASGADPIYLIEQEKQAQLDFLEWKAEQDITDAERERLKDERAQVYHNAKMARIAEQKRRDDELAKKLEENRKREIRVYQTTASAIQGSGRLIGQAMGLAGADQLHVTGVVQAIQAAAEIANAAADYASQNYLGGVMHTAAAGLATAASVKAFAEAGKMGRGGSSGLGGGMSFGGGGGGGGGGGAPPGSDSGVPLSRSGERRSGLGGTSPGGTSPGGTRNYNITIGTMVGSDDTAKIELHRMITDVERSLGAVV